MDVRSGVHDEAGVAHHPNPSLVVRRLSHGGAHHVQPAHAAARDDHALLGADVIASHALQHASVARKDGRSESEECVVDTVDAAAAAGAWAEPGAVHEAFHGAASLKHDTPSAHTDASAGFRQPVRLPSAWMKWAFLFCVVFATVGPYYVYDNPSATQSALREHFGIPLAVNANTSAAGNVSVTAFNADYQLLFSLYSFPNTVRAVCAVTTRRTRTSALVWRQSKRGCV
ncbi:hypothetical protein EON67_00120 [archaeon]|nr:MAG: hypothetical protein EON67_00120 [archaeon]